MTQRHEIYRCEACGSIVEVLHPGAGKLVCCGQEMELLSENSVDAAVEKHVPVIRPLPDGLKAKVGSVPHPMEEKHYIEWLEVRAGGLIARLFLAPGGAAQASFVGFRGAVTARAYCNLHGLWKSQEEVK